MYKNLNKLFLRLFLVLIIIFAKDIASLAYEEIITKESFGSFGGSDSENFFSLKETSDGGYVAAGYTRSKDLGYTQNGGWDALIVKFKKNDDVEWARNFGGSSTDYFFGAIEASDGGYVAVGYSRSTNAEFDNKGGADAIIVKYDRDGNQL
jgi:hypothetical protein